MVFFARSKKTFFIIEIAAILVLVFSSFTPLLSSAAIKGFTLPCTISTTGNAWNGETAFPLQAPNNNNYLVVMSTNGDVLNLRESTGIDAYTGSIYDIGNNTLLFQGEPYVDGANSAPTGATHIWNLTTNTTEDSPMLLGSMIFNTTQSITPF